MCVFFILYTVEKSLTWRALSVIMELEKNLFITSIHLTFLTKKSWTHHLELGVYDASYSNHSVILNS